VSRRRAEPARPSRRASAEPSGPVADLERRLAAAMDRGSCAGTARALLELGRSYARAGDPSRAAPCFERAIGLAAAPLATRRAAAAALSALVAASAARSAPPAPGGGSAADGRLRRAVEAARALGSIDDPDRLLDACVDRAIDLSGAERGFLALAGDGTATLRIARDLTGAALREPDIVLSRSILDLALRRGRPVLAADAGRDRRFSAFASVRALKVRSVLAVPLPGPAGPLGAIYLDHRLKSGAFDAARAEAVEAFAALASVAIQRAQALADARAARAALDPAPPALPSPAPAGPPDFPGIVGRSTAMRAVFRLIERIAPSDLPVFICGETGTGKELVARALHARSARSAGPFVSESCAAIPESLLESEVFGYERGAFTGAQVARPGLFERAHGGTLFLDEVGEMSPALQAKLLRALQEREVRRLGGSAPRKVDVRIVAASNRDLRDLVARGAFRQDLFFRLHVVRVDLPPLRERREDLAPLAAHILARLAGIAPPLELSPEARRRLFAHDFPGNVRELEGILRRAAVLAGAGPIGLEHLPREIAAPAAGLAEPQGGPSLFAARRRAGLRAERELVARALAAAGGNVSRAAREAGVSRATMHRMLARHGLRGGRRRR